MHPLHLSFIFTLSIEDCDTIGKLYTKMLGIQMENRDSLDETDDVTQIITADKYYNFDYFAVSDLYLIIIATHTSLRKCALDANMTRKRLVRLMEDTIEPTSEELTNIRRVAKKLHYDYFYGTK